MTPFEAWNGRKPDISNIRIFGSRAFVRCPNAKKLEARCLEGAFVGISDTQKASRIYISSPPPRVIVSHDVKIDETIMYRKLKDETAIQRIEPSIVKQQSINVPIDDTIGTDILVPDTVTSPTTVPDATSNHNAVSHHETAFRDEEEQCNDWGFR